MTLSECSSHRITMAAYSHSLRGLYIDTDNATRLVTNETPVARMDVKLLGDNDQVINTHCMEYYILSDDLLVYIRSEEPRAYISDETVYADGESAVRNEFKRFVRQEQIHGDEIDMRIQEDIMPFDLGLSFPLRIKRGDTTPNTHDNKASASNR